MKRILFYIVPNSQDNPKKIFFQTNKNSFLLQILQKQNLFTIIYENLIFDSKTCQQFCAFIEPAIIEAIQKSEGEIYYNKQNLIDIKGAIHASFNLAVYQKPDSIFDFCADIFVKLLMGHKLLDGNKRFSLAYLKAILWHLGYDFISYDKGKQLNPYSSQYHPKASKFVCLLEQKDKYYDTISSIVNWVKENTFIAKRWRQKLQKTKKELY